MSGLDNKVIEEYDKEIEERFGLEPLKSTEEKVMDRLKKYLKEEIDINKSDVAFAIEDIRETKQIGDAYYRIAPVSTTYEELLDLINRWEKEYEYSRRKKICKRSK